MKQHRRMWIAAGCLPAAVALASDGSAPLGEPAGMTHRMMMLALQLGVLLFVARLGNSLFERLRLPGVLGEIAGGMAFGPFALGGVPLPRLGFPHGLFPVYHDAGPAGTLVSFPVSPELYGFCAVASIILLFLVGLETDLAKFLRYSLAGSLVGIGGVAVSFAVGAAVGLALLPRPAGVEHSILSPAIVFLGLLSTATSVGITARILSDKRKLDSPEGVTILAGAVIDDVLGIVLLVIGLGVIAARREGGGVHWGEIGRLAIKTVGVWLLATVTGLLASRRISTLLKLFRDRMSIAVLALGLALILAGLFEEARLAMIIGAYVMGLSLSRSDISRLVAERLHAVHAFFVPIFFAVMGMLVDVSQLASPAVLAFGAIYTVSAIGAKIVGCGLPPLLSDFNWMGALRIGVGMVPRGEVALIIAGIGLSAGILPADVFGVSVLMTFCTTMIAPPLLVALFRNPRPGVRRIPVAETLEPIVYEFPSADAAELIAVRLLEVLAGEGFFTHELDPVGHIYQIRKDDVVFGFRQEGTRLVFECHPAEAVLIGTAMTEVVADFERLVGELRRPLDRGRLPDHVAALPAAVHRGVEIVPHLRYASLLPALRGDSKAAVIDELLDALRRAGAINYIEPARAAIWEREHLQSTGLQHGLAMPHGRTALVRELVCAVGLKRKGVPFDSIDGEPARIVVLTLCPQTAGSPYVEFLAAVSRRLHAFGRLSLLACETPAQMLDWFGFPPSGDAAEPGALGRLLRRLGLRAVAGPRTPDGIVPRIGARDVRGVLDALIRAARALRPALDADSALAAVWERELECPSGLERGIALPHARAPGLERPLYLLGLVPGGADFKCADGSAARVALLCLYPPAFPGPMLRETADLIARIEAAGAEALSVLDETSAARALAIDNRR